jgi:DNA-binding PadR family transcriptional regulator
MNAISPRTDLALTTHGSLPHPTDPVTRREMAAELLAPVVLILLAEGPARTSELAAALSELCCDELDELALEDLLAAAEASKLVTSRVQSDPDHCAYELTGQGREALSLAVAAIERTHRMMSAMTSRYEKSAGGWSLRSKASATSS